MSQVRFVSDSEVKLIDSLASDKGVVQAARVSFDGEESIDAQESEGLINFLIKNKHSSPTEHNIFKFYIKTPIFVAREFQRHRHFCIAGDSIITLCASSTHKEQRNYPIETIWENWHLGVPDSSPRERKIYVTYRKRFDNWRVWHTTSDTVGGKEQHYIHEVGIYLTKKEADEAASAVEKTTWRRRKLPSTRNIYAISIDESTGLQVKNKVLEVIKVGKKSVWEVKMVNGQHLKSTMEHRFYTPDGWKQLKQLSVGDDVWVSGRIGVRQSKDGMMPPDLRKGIGQWTSRMRQFLIDEDGGNCYICKNFFPKDQLALDHVVPVAKDISLSLSETNLKPACKKCHRQKTNGEQSLGGKRGGLCSTVIRNRIVSINYVGEEETYDLSMEAPNHNFLANGFVVHNSYNETSARYSELKPVFYVPSADRPLVQEGKPGAYHFVAGTDYQYKGVVHNFKEAYELCWEAYQDMLEGGIAKEVARDILPVGIMTQFYATCNARTLMHFLSLRTAPTDHSKVPSYPLWEIAKVADKMEVFFKEKMPLTWKSWDKNGRQSL